jgi:hypothetical protein
MTDFGTPEERAAALRVCEACKALNDALSDAGRAGVNIKIIDLNKSWDDPTRLRIERMERRVPILPTALSAIED